MLLMLASPQAGDGVSPEQGRTPSPLLPMLGVSPGHGGVSELDQVQLPLMSTLKSFSLGLLSIPSPSSLD